MARKQDNAPVPPAEPAQPAYTVVKRTRDRWWEVRDPRGELVCVTVYKREGVRGKYAARYAEGTNLVPLEVVRRLAA